MILLLRRRGVKFCINRHEVLADKHAAEQSGERPAFGSGAERYVSFKQVNLLATLEANAARHDEAVGRQACAGMLSPEVVVAK